jgi:spermidine synthase
MNSNEWFTEIFAAEGSAFSVKIKSKLHEEKSNYQQIAIYDTEKFGHLMVIDGCVMLTQRDNFFYHEMLSHTALFTHPDPKEVVIIGGGDCGTLRETLKHSRIEKVTQIDIDERVTRLSEIYFPELCASNNDPRAHFYFGDGIAWIANCEKSTADVIVIDSTDPVGVAEGLFSTEFYRQCFAALKPNGVLICQSESPLYHVELIRTIQGHLVGSGFASTATLSFPQPCYPSGWWSATMAGKGVDVGKFRVAAAEQRLFSTQYYNAAIHKAALSIPEFMAA